MTVNPGVSGFNHFAVGITPLVPHSGEETVVFIHLRNGQQLGLNGSRADSIPLMPPGPVFNVRTGDVIKACIVDELTNAEDHNPVILQ